MTRPDSEPAAIRDDRRRVARGVGWTCMATALACALLSLFPGVSRLGAATTGTLGALALGGGALVVLAARRGTDGTVLLALRTLIPLTLAAVLGGFVATGPTDLVGLSFVGFIYVLSAFSLPRRDNLVVLVAGTAAVLVAVVPSPAAAIWPVVASVAIGGLAHVGARVHVGTVVELQRQRDVADTASRALRGVVDAARRATTGEVEDVLDAAVDATDDLGFDRAAVVLVEPDGAVVARTSHEADTAVVDRMAGSQQGLTMAVVRSGRTLVVDDYRSWPGRIDHDSLDDVKAAVGTPVRVGDHVAGAFVAARTTRVAPDDATLSAFELLADHVGRALTLARAVGEDRTTLAELRRLRQLQEDFVSTVSHELRTPLTVIDGAAETLVERGHRIGPALTQTLLRRISTNARGLDQVISSILEMARLDRGLAEFVPLPGDLATLGEECLRRLSPGLADPVVEGDLAPGAVVRGDADLLDRALDNLVLNAARHTPPGTTIAITTEASGGHVDVVVADDGPGIPADELAHVTERFRRVGPHTTRSARGLGIGLALVEQVLRVHGTVLRIDSRVGEGSRFAFRLPTPAERDEPTHRPAAMTT